MKAQLEQIKQQALAALEAAQTPADLDELRIKVLGKKGELNALMEEFKQVPAEQKREVGQKINALKQAAQENPMQRALLQM